MVVEKNIKIFCLALAVFALTIFMYSSIFSHQFGYHNDYRIWEYNAQKNFFGYPETRHLIGVGRPILAILFSIHMRLVNDMYALHVSQIISVISICFLATLYYLYLQRKLDINYFSAALLSVLTFTLPSIAINSFWITNFTSEIIPLYIAFFAYILLEQQANTTKMARLIIAVGLLLFLNLLIYPPATFFFFTLTFIKLLFGPKNVEHAKLKYIFIEVLMLLAVSFIYYMIIKLTFIPYLVKHPYFLYEYIGGLDWNKFYQSIAVQYEFNIGLSFRQKEYLILNLMNKWLQMKDYVILCISTWFPPFRLSWVLVFLCGCIGILVSASFLNPYLKNRSPIVRMTMGVIILTTIAILTTLPCLIGPSSYTINYRVTFTSMAILPALITFVIDRILRHDRHPFIVYMTLLITFILIISAELTELHRLTLLVDRSTTEYSWIKRSLIQKLSDKTSQIYVQKPLIQSPDHDYLYADFGLNATDISTWGIIKVALKEIQREPMNYGVIYTSAATIHNKRDAILIEAEPIYKPSNGILLNHILGRWIANGQFARIAIENGVLMVHNETGGSSRGVFTKDGKYLMVPDWNNMKATASNDYKEIRWDNGTRWDKL